MPGAMAAGRAPRAACARRVGSDGGGKGQTPCLHVRNGFESPRKGSDPFRQDGKDG